MPFTAQDPSRTAEIQGHFVFSGRSQRLPHRAVGKDLGAARTNSQANSDRETGRCLRHVGDHIPGAFDLPVAQQANHVARSHRVSRSNVEIPPAPTLGCVNGPSATAYLQAHARLYQESASLTRILFAQVLSGLERGRESMESPQESGTLKPPSQDERGTSRINGEETHGDVEKQNSPSGYLLSLLHRRCPGLKVLQNYWNGLYIGIYGDNIESKGPMLPSFCPLRIHSGCVTT